MSKIKKKELGKGIRALLTHIDTDNPEVQDEQDVVEKISTSVFEIPISQIESNPFQPRKEFNEEAIAELAESIKVHGIIQPITVRLLAKDQYQLISGERRWRASQLAGLKAIPAYVRLANDQEMLEMALVENIQRQDLNAMEIAITYQRLIDECNLTHDALSERMGKKRSTISNYLRLLKLPPEMQRSLKAKEITMGHARALAGIEDIGVQLSVFREILQSNLSVRATESLIQRYSKKGSKGLTKAKQELSQLDKYYDVTERLSAHLGSKVQVKANERGNGVIRIPFSSTEDLNRILDLLED
jgi:ParB family chromosome partitioning protein